MNIKISHHSRRMLLKSIVVGSGTAFAGKSLPNSWVKPVVDSILLPAHAMTTDQVGNLTSESTPTTPTTPVACPSLSISSDSVNCGDGSQFSRFRYYYVDDTGECPVLVEVGYSTPGPGSSDVIKSGVSIDSLGTLRAYFGIRGDSLNKVVQICGTSYEGSPSTIYNVLFTAVSGAQWIATGVISQSATNVSVSEITLTPV